MIGKVGPKGRHIQLPVGWEQVSHPQMGDKYLNATLFQQKGTIQWLDVDEEDLTWPERYDCLIRKTQT